MMVRWAIRIGVAVLIIVVGAVCLIKWYYASSSRTYTIGVVIPNCVNPYNEKNVRGMKIRTAVELFKEMYDDDNSVLRKKILAGLNVAGVRIKFQFCEERLGGESHFFERGHQPTKIADYFGGTDVVAVIGHMHNEQAKKVMPVYKSKGIPLISPKASDPEFAGSSGLAFSMIYNDYLQAAVMSEYIKHYLTPQWVVLVNDKGSGRRRPYRLLIEELRRGLQTIVKPKNFYDVDTKRIYHERPALVEQYKKCSNGLIVLVERPWRAARTVERLRACLPPVPIMAPDALTDEKFLESFSLQAARAGVPPPRLGADKKSDIVDNGLRGYLIMVVEKEKLQTYCQDTTDQLCCRDIEDSQIGAGLCTCSQAFRSRKELDKLARLGRELKDKRLLKGVFFYTDDCPCEVQTQLEREGLDSAKNVDEFSSSDTFAPELQCALARAADIACSFQVVKVAGEGEGITRAEKRNKRRFLTALRKEAVQFSERWAKHGVAFAGKDENYWEELRLLVANPFFFEVAPVEAHKFLKEFRKKWKERPSGTAESNKCPLEEDPKTAPKPSFPVHTSVKCEKEPSENPREEIASKDETDIYKLEDDPNPTTDALLFVDAAVLVTRAILSLPRERKLTADEQRALIREYLSKVKGKQAVKGFTGDLRFDDKGNRDTEVLFSWIRNDRFRPSYGQFKLISEQDYHLITSRPGDSCQEEDPGWAKVPIWSDSADGQEKQVVRYLKPRDMVYAGLQFDRINAIELRSQTFDAEAFVWFKWLYDKECKTRPQCLSKPFLITERPQEQRANLLELGPLALFWEPVQFWNGVYTQSGKIAKIIKKRVIRDRWSGEEINYVAFRIKGTFMHEYNLENYPLDRQDLPIDMSLFCSTDTALIAVDGEPQTSDPMIAPREYCQTKYKRGVRHHYSGTRRMGASLGDPNWQTQLRTGIDFSVYRASLHVQRHVVSYLYKTFLPLLVLNLVSLVAFWISLRRFEVRMTLTITALLSAIVLYLASTAQLPNVGYTTLVDWLFVASYVAMCLNIAAAIILEWMRRKWRRKEKMKNWAPRTNAIWPTIVAIVLFFLSAIYVGSWNRVEMRPWHLICIGVLAAFLGVTWVLHHWRPMPQNDSPEPGSPNSAGMITG